MSKINSIVDLIEAGIRAENFRQRAIANNFANLETPGYRRVDVEFKELLAACSDSPEQVDFSKVEPQTYEPRQTPVGANGNDISMELEVGQMIKNSLRHKAYIRLLSKKYSQIELAINAP